MNPGTFNFPLPFQRGDSFNGHIFEVKEEIAGVVSPVDFTGADILIQLRVKPGSPVILEWKTSDAGITISGADNNIITMGTKTGEQMDIEGGTYRYDINVKLANDVTNTYVKGTMVIVDDISRAT